MMTKRLGLHTVKYAVAACGLAVLSACSMFSSTDPRFSPAALENYEASAAVSVRWNTSIGKSGGFGFTPARVGERIYAATPSGDLVQVNIQNGQIVWRVNTNKNLSAGVGADDRVVAVAARDGTVLAYDTSGKELWQAKASSEVSIPPAVGDGVVVVRSSDYRVQAFNAQNGELLWSLQRPGPALALKTNIKMEVFDGLVITGMPNGRLMIIDAQSGAVQWEGLVSQSRGATDLERINDVVGGPIAAGSLLCGASYQGRIVCFDVSQGGFSVWQRDFSTTTGLATNGRILVGSNQRDVVTAFAIQDGTVVWTQDGLLNRKLSGPAIVNNYVAVGDYQGYLHFLASSDGRLVGRLQVGSGAISSPLMATEYGVITQTGNGNLVLVGVN